MPKRWSEVEQSPEYLNLSGQQRFQAKKQYWQNVVENRKEYTTLNPESQGQAKSQFFGGILPEDDSAKQPRMGVNVDIPIHPALMGDFSGKKDYSLPMRVGPEAVGETLGTAGRSTGQLAKSVITPILHPIQTAKRLAQAVRHPVQTGKAVVSGLGERYGSLENIAKTVAEDPAGFVGDVYMGAGIAGAGVRTVGRIAGNPNVIRAGSFPMSTRGEGLPTVKQAASVTKQAMGQALTKARIIQSPQQMAQKATNIYRDILRPTQGEVKNINVKQGKDIDKYYRLAAEEGLTIKRTFDNKLDTAEAIQALKPKIEALHENLNTVLRSDPQPKFDLMDIADSAKQSLRQTIKNADELVKAERDVNRYIGAEIKRYGPVVNAETLNNVKQGMWSVGYDALRPTSKATARKLGNIAKRRIEDAFPDEQIRALNAKSGDYLTLTDLLENAQGRVIKGGRLGQYVAGTIGAVAGSKVPIVGPIAGAMVGNRVVKAMYSPERLSKFAAGKMAQAQRRMPPPAFVPEIVSDLRVPVTDRLALPGRRPLQITAQTKALPAPKDVPYRPTGSRVPPARPIRTPNVEGGAPIQSGTTYGKAEKLRADLEAFKKSDYVKGIKKQVVKVEDAAAKKAGFIKPSKKIKPSSNEITVYHRTNASPEIIKKQGFKSLENTGEVFVSNRKNGQAVGYGDNVIKFKINKKYLNLDDEFPSGEKHYSVDSKILNKIFKKQQ